MAIKVGRIHVSTHVHATEDRELVMGCLEKFLAVKTEFNSIKAEGTFKNPIFIIEAGIKKNKKRFIKDIIARLSTEDRDRVRSELESRLSRGTLYLRFDKMKACEGKVALGDGIQLTASLITYPHDAEVIMGQVREWF